MARDAINRAVRDGELSEATAKDLITGYEAALAYVSVVNLKKPNLT